MSLYAYKVGLSMRVKILLGAKFRHLIEQSWSFSEAEAEAYQASAFSRIYSTGRHQVPYFDSRTTEYPNWTDQPPKDSLRSLPVLTKEAVRRHNAALWAAPLSHFTTFHSTSGSTGTAVNLAASPFEPGFMAQPIHKWISRITKNDSPRPASTTGLFAPSREALFHSDGPLGTLHLSIRHINDRHRNELIERIRAFQPDLIYGYPSTVAALARVTDGQIAIPTAVTTSEVLLPEWRSLIEGKLSAKTYDMYGSQEASHFVYECEHRQNHVNPLAAIVEILDREGRPTPLGTPVRIVITSLVRHSMPLTRYEIGAGATWERKTCECGPYPFVVGTVDGRMKDQVLTKDGARIGMLAAPLFRTSPDIRESQLVQHSLDDFEVRLVLTPPPVTPTAEIQRRITDLLRARLNHPAARVRFTYPPEIEKLANRNFRAVKVNL